MKYFNFNMKAVIKFSQKTKNTTLLKQNIFRLFFFFCSLHSLKRLEGSVAS